MSSVYDIITVVIRSTAPLITDRFRSELAASGLKRRTGKSAQGFNYRIRRDSTSADIWGVSFTTVRYIYMHHHGMQSKMVKGRKRSYQSKGYAKLHLLTQPAVEGAAMLGNALAKAEADYFVTRINF